MIQIDLNRCTGCRRCETACTFFHTGRINPEMSRIRVGHLYELGVDGPVVCQQCSERYCLACPENAMTLGESGQVKCTPTLCTLCGSCEKACPIGAVNQFQDFVYVCDLCGEDPKCVRACTENAIVFKPSQSPSLKDIHEKTRGLNPEEKRYYYLMQQSSTLRESWKNRES